MPVLELKRSPHAPEASPVQIHYRDVGSGPPVVFLHGGWGYGVYPIDSQIEALQDRVRFLIPDRSGHGRSTNFPGEMPTNFHRLAAEETLLMLDELGTERAIFWGHSDGAVIAAIIGMRAPERCDRLILEAFHFYRRKPSSRSFFQRFADHPEHIKENLQTLLIMDHGDPQWKNVVQRNCHVWLRLAAESVHPDEDLYGGRLGELQVPVTFVHGRGDPRTEPGEIERASAHIAGAQVRFLEEGKHSPHSEERACRELNGLLGELFGG